MRKQTEIQRIISYHDKRNGSGKLLCTFMIKLSLVLENISGPGNWPLIRIPYHQKKKKRLSRYDTSKKQSVYRRIILNTLSRTTNLLTDTEGVYVTIGDIPVEEPIRIFSTNKSQKNKDGVENPCRNSGQFQQHLYQEKIEGDRSRL